MRAPFHLVAQLAPAMAERGHGAIIDVSTMVAEHGVVGMALYGSSKAAVNLLTKTWAAEFGPHGSGSTPSTRVSPVPKAQPKWAMTLTPSLRRPRRTARRGARDRPGGPPVTGGVVRGFRPAPPTRRLRVHCRSDESRLSCSPTGRAWR
ncbi:SDR family oxidoreductase [Streptomyces sp. NBC_01788]|nr:SDR family oxidoreductase [Streptomyces sp. NBC_01788]